MESWGAARTGAVTRYVTIILLALATGGALITPSAPAAAADGDSGGGSPQFTAKNESGVARTINVAGFPVFADTNPFFQDLGINGRRCVTCHQPDDNMTVTPERIQARFEATQGRDPIFRTNDGSNSPLADVSTVEARREAYSMLLTKGLIRIGLPIPEGAEFDLVSVHDPYGFASAAELSLFRRPLPSTNLAFLSTVMWDGRETLERGSASAIHFDLADQSNSATTGHAQRPTLIPDALREAIVAYEMGLFTAQVFDRAAGALDARGATGGPEELSRQTFVFGVNDPLGCDGNGAHCTGVNAGFDPVVFTEFDAWQNLSGHGRNRARVAVARPGAVQHEDHPHPGRLGHQ
jgi:cytochrome c peroxidase